MRVKDGGTVIGGRKIHVAYLFDWYEFDGLWAELNGIAIIIIIIIEINAAVAVAAADAGAYSHILVRFIDIVIRIK